MQDTLLNGSGLGPANLMHIGFVTPEYATPEAPDGGLANYVRNVSAALSTRDCQVTVFTLGNCQRQWRDGAVTVHMISRSWLRKLRGRWLGPAAALLPAVTIVRDAQRLRDRVWRVHGDTPLDIIQASSYGAPGVALLGNKRVPVVCRVSSYTPLVRSAYGWQRDLSQMFLDWLEVRQVAKAARAFAPSHLMADAFARIEALPVEVLRTPVASALNDHDDRIYRQHLSGISYLLFFGTLSRIKGVDLLADVLPELFTRHPDLHFAFVGRDDGLPDGRRLTNVISDACADYRDQVHIFPAIPKAELLPIVANARGVVMPSRIDNYPNACIEAQQLGIPVVGTYGSSLDEMIVDGRTGFLAKNGDITDIADAINRLLAQTPTQREAMTQAILADVQAAISEDRVGQLTEFCQQTIRAYHNTGGA